MEIRMLTQAGEFAAFEPLLPLGVAPDGPEIVLGAWAGAKEDKQAPLYPAGTLVARMMEQGELRIEWLYVNPPHRRGRLGSELIGYLAEAAAWQEQVFMLTASFDEAAAQCGVRAVFEHEGFEIEPAGTAYSFTLQQLATLPVLQRYGARTEGLELVDLAEAGAPLLNTATTLLEKGGAPVQLPLVAEAYAPGSLLCRQGRQVVGVLLVAAQGGQLSLPLLYTTSAPAVPALVAGAAARLQALHPPQTVVRLCAATPPALALAQKLLPEAEHQPVWLAVMELPLMDTDQIAWMEKVLVFEDEDEEAR